MKKLLHALACIFIPALLLGQTVPSQVNYQGQLLDSAGAPLPNGEYTVTMSLYDAATSGALVWGPQIFDGQGLIGHGPRVPVVGGYFNLILSTDTNSAPIANAFFNGATRYLEIRVGSNPAISPRQQILSAPFALNADRLGGTNWSAVFDTGNPGTGRILGTRIADGSITAAQIVDGTITSADIGVGAIRSNNIASGAVYNSHISSLNKLTREGTTTTAAYVNANGELGVGTTGPGGRLDIVGFRTDPVDLYSPSAVVIGGSSGTILLRTGRNETGYDEALTPALFLHQPEMVTTRLPQESDLLR